MPTSAISNDEKRTIFCLSFFRFLCRMLLLCMNVWWIDSDLMVYIEHQCTLYTQICFAWVSIRDATVSNRRWSKKKMYKEIRAPISIQCVFVIMILENGSNYNTFLSPFFRVSVHSVCKCSSAISYVLLLTLFPHSSHTLYMLQFEWLCLFVFPSSSNTHPHIHSLQIHASFVWNSMELYIIWGTKRAECSLFHTIVNVETSKREKKTNGIRWIISLFYNETDQRQASDVCFAGCFFFSRGFCSCIFIVHIPLWAIVCSRQTHD